MAPVRMSLAHSGLPAFSMMNPAKLPHHMELTCGPWTLPSPPALGGQVGKQQGLPSGLPLQPKAWPLDGREPPDTRSYNYSGWAH